MKYFALLLTSISLALFSCSEEKVEPTKDSPQEEPPVKEQPAKVDSISLIHSAYVTHSNSGGSYDAKYTITRDADNSVKSITFLKYYDDGTTGEQHITNFVRNGNVITLSKSVYGIEKEFTFTSDSLIQKIITTYEDGSSYELIFEMTDGLLQSYGNATVNYRDGDKIASIEYDAENPDNIVFSVNGNNKNPIRGIKCLELIAMMYEVELHEGVLFSRYQIESGHGSYSSYDFSYEYDRDGNISKINRTDNTEELDQYKVNSDITFEYNKVPK